MPQRRAAGFSLVETIAAMGLAAMVMVTIAGLFSVGGRQVRSGRHSSEALAIANLVLEEMNAGAFKQIWQRFDAPGTFTSAGFIADTDTNDAASSVRWRSLLHDRLGPTARAAIRIDALAESGAPPDLDGDPRAVRITVTVSWTEQARVRRVTLVTVRT